MAATEVEFKGARDKAAERADLLRPVVGLDEFDVATAADAWGCGDSTARKHLADLLKHHKVTRVRDVRTDERPGRASGRWKLTPPVEDTWTPDGWTA